MRSQRHAPAALYLRERPATHCTGGWVGPRDVLNRCGTSRPPPGFDPRTVQPVASRYTDWAIPAHSIREQLMNSCTKHSHEFRHRILATAWLNDCNTSSFMISTLYSHEGNNVNIWYLPCPMCDKELAALLAVDCRYTRCCHIPQDY
jgi:hypothetical protein